MSDELLIYVTGAVVALLLTIYLIVRLRLFKPESVVVLAGVVLGFLIGFLGPFLDGNLRSGLEVASALVAVALSFAIGRLSKSRASAFLAGAVLLPLTLVALGYGVYEARATGWQDLKPLGQGSDHPGVETIWFWFFTGTPFLGRWTVVSGAFAAWIHSRKSSRPPPRPTANRSPRQSEAWE